MSGYRWPSPTSIRPTWMRTTTTAWSMITADYLAARQDTLDLLHQFIDEQLAAPLPTVVGEQTPGDFFAGRAGHAATHMTWIEAGFRQGM